MHPMSKHILPILMCFLSLSTSAQFLDKIYLEPEYVIKFSVGEATNRSFVYNNTLQVNVPERSRFNYPVQGLNLTIGYALSDRFSVGVGSGIHVAKFENHPLIGSEYFDSVFLPLYLRLRYQKDFSNQWMLLTDLDGGYQFYHVLWGNREEGFLFEGQGGLLLNLNVGIGKEINRFTPILKIGYELNQFSNEASLGMFPSLELDYNDKVFYKSYYHLIRVSLSIQI